MKKGKAIPIIMLSKTDSTVTSLNNLTDDITILSNANIQVTTEGQTIKIDSSQVSANKADIATNFNKYLAGIQKDGTCSRNDDCNNALVNGRWYSEGTPNDPNAPTGSNGILETYRDTTGSVYQKYTPYASSSTAINRFYQRSGTDASTKVVWSKWVEFNTTINYELRVGDLIWNDTTAKAMSSNMMPATGIHYLDPIVFPELFLKIGYSKGRKGDLFKVGIDTNYPYLSMVRTGRGIGSNEGDAFKSHKHLSGVSVTNGNVSHYTAVNATQWAKMGLSIQTNPDYAEPWGQTIGDTSTRPANTACYLNRVTSTGQNEALELALKGTPLLKVRCIATTNNREGFADNELIGEMEVPFNYQTTRFHYDKDNNIILDKVEYWISESQTKVEPLETKEGFTQLFKNDKFEYIEDHREEEVYLKTDGSLFTITELGEIPNEYTTIAPPTYAQYYKFNTDKWVLDASKKDNLISVISDKVKSQTNINMEASKWIRSTEEQEFEDAEIHMQFVNIENALDFTDTLASKTMEELIELLITDKLNI